MGCYWKQAFLWEKSMIFYASSNAHISMPYWFVLMISFLLLAIKICLEYINLKKLAFSVEWILNLFSYPFPLAGLSRMGVYGMTSGNLMYRDQNHIWLT